MTEEKKEMNIEGKMTRILAVGLVVQGFVMLIGYGAFLIHPLLSIPVVAVGTIWNAIETRKLTSHRYDEQGRIL